MRQEIDESAIPSGDVGVPGSVVLIFSTTRGFLDHYRSMFKSLGFTPIVATSAEAVAALLRLLVVALVVVDEESGKIESGQILRSSQHMQYHAPILVIGGRSGSDFRCQALALGAADYLDHPASPDDIIHALLPSHAPRKGRTAQTFSKR